MVHCFVCGANLKVLGWPSHIAKEKRIHGDDVYLRLRKAREKEQGKPPTRKELAELRSKGQQKLTNADKPAAEGEGDSGK